MLSLQKIVKDYIAGDTTVQALKGISVNFRENEFVSILGPSGCGKTTMLNIIGGLDKYTDGDLFINGVSTKQFSAKDWDVYRNHRIGFIFQSYNLIPHQTVLQNVELALTIAGVSKSERARRAKNALDTVGLSGQYGKKPNQLSGGQCQRVAIARALVNEPEILLADEPTGALDTETSVQIMELIKNIAEQRLVIMVTHNPDLAEHYSTRIINLLDGEIVGDSNPLSNEDELDETKAISARAAEKIAAEEAQAQSDIANGKKRRKNVKEKAKMSPWTALRLSARNLSSKKKRTALTSFAGSIGIIGISMVLSLSYGIQSFISGMQTDMLSGNPIAITQSAYDLNALMSQTTPFQKTQAAVQAGFVNVDSMVEYLVERSEQITNITVSNTIKPEYVSYVSAIPDKYDAMVKLDYGLSISNNIYVDYKRDDTTASEKISIAGVLAKYSSVLKTTKFGQYASYISSLSSAFSQAPNDKDYLLTQYDLLSGDIASGHNEVMIVVNGDTELTDLLLAELGYYSEDEFLNIVYRATDDARYDASLDKKAFTYEELTGRTFTLYNNDVIFTENTDAATRAQFPYFYNETADTSWTNGVELTVSGILKPKEDISYGCLSTGFYYTEELANYLLETNATSEFIHNLFALNTEEARESYTSVIVNGAPVSGVTYTYDFSYYDDDKNWVTETATTCVGSTSQMSMFLSLMGMGGGSGGAATETFTLTVQELGGNSIPVGIYVYPVSFEEKDKVLSYLDAWNSQSTDITVDGVLYRPDAREKITYTDTLSLVINIINTLVNVITYALIAFTALSLIVSCVMIAVTTYISIAERTKEIGIIRSLGGRKSDVSSLFNAETLMIGATSGILGIIITYILTAIVNGIVKGLAGIASIAIFPWYYALMMLAISIVLTVLSGLIPSSSAAKKDPVVALRTE